MSEGRTHTAIAVRRSSGTWVRVALTTFALLLIYDGALRKWFFPGMERSIFVFKDMLLLSTFLVLTVDWRKQPSSHVLPAAGVLIGAYASWVLAEAFNPALPSLLVGLWGVKCHLLYALLVLLVPPALHNLKRVFATLEGAYVWAVAPVVAVSLVQLASPAYSTINQTVRGGEEGVAQFGYAGLVRVSGTFSYVSGMASFVQVSTLLGVALFLSGARSRSFLVGLAFALLSVPVTGSRSVVVILVVGAAILLVAATVCRFIKGSYALLVALVLALFSVISVYSQDAAWQALAERAESSQGDQNRTVTTFTNAFGYFQTAGGVGFGAGSANLGSPSLVEGVQPFSWLPMGDRFEEESGRIVIELGVIGWFISIAMRVVFAFWAGVLALRGATRNVRAAGVMALPFIVLGVYLGNGVFAPPIAPAFYWFCVALLAMAQHEHDVALRQRRVERVQRLLAVEHH